MTIVVIMIIAAAIILVAWMWNNLGKMEISKKIEYVIGGLVITYILTFIIYNISKIGITYESKEVMNTIRVVFVAVFSIINGYIILPFTFKRLNQLSNDEIEKDKFRKSIIRILIIIIIVFIFEAIYLGNIQQGILNMR